MGRYDNRFASDSVFHTYSPSARAEVIERLTNPGGLSVGPARLVAVIDGIIQEALEETPIVLWEAEELIRFELPEARILLALREAETPAQSGLTLGVVFEGPNAEEIASALARLIARTIQSRFPTFEHAPGAAEVPGFDAESAALFDEPLSGSSNGLPPVDSLADRMWSRAEACAPVPQRQAAPLAAPRPWAWLARLSPGPAPRFSLPVLRPMRSSVRALAFLLLAMGLIQGPMGPAAQAETSNTAP
ncbi:hypothetical protein [Stagnihabitans tardus]|uniref:Uncharacterized protein n=1 Tax=Stagnihabitans tardus TaxID=2699202 RepID=A0AAE5BR24_9RHOB|nr:hypothetical protein [Stagnihabitans tardus]NBZ86060.1 hypothetical protein [Stagnihabitans tardus]